MRREKKEGEAFEVDDVAAVLACGLDEEEDPEAAGWYPGPGPAAALVGAGMALVITTKVPWFAGTGVLDMVEAAITGP